MAEEKDKTKKVEENVNVQKKMAEAKPGVLGDRFVDDYYVPRCY